MALDRDIFVNRRSAFYRAVAPQQRNGMDTTEEACLEKRGSSSFDVSNGEKGDTGPAGQNATINGVTVLSLDAKDGVSLIQEGQNATISGKTLKDGILSLQNTKQDNINDLDDIRSGASDGATAVQPNDMATAISTHNTSSQAHEDIRRLIADETTNRENADNGLQSQIDAITASSDVTDIVGTYAQLQAYDTSTLPPNSIIKVLQDESRNNETTYYRWVINGGVGSWVLIGEEGPYYTKSEADERFATAAQGAKADTALQPAALNGYATETWVGQQGFLTSTALIGYATEQWVTNQGYLTSSALNGYATEQWVQNRGYITQAVDDSSTTSTTLGWSASKLNGIIGDIESTINAIRGV